MVKASLRTKSVGTKVSDAEFAALEARARAENLTLSEWMRKTFSNSFSMEGSFAGRSIADVAGGLRSGSIAVSDVSVQYIVRDGNTLILNTRSAMALEEAGIPRSQWNGVNMTGNAAAEARLTAQLNRNGLTPQGTPTVNQK